MADRVFEGTPEERLLRPERLLEGMEGYCVICLNCFEAIDSNDFDFIPELDQEQFVADGLVRFSKHDSCQASV